MATESLVRQIDHFAVIGLMSVPVKTGPSGLSVLGNSGGVEAASQAWLSGAPLIASSGKLAEAATDPIAAILGFANADASGVTNQGASFIPAGPGLEFEATLENSSTGDLALALTHMYVKYGLKRITASKLWYVDQNDTSGVAVIVTGFVDPVGTIQGRVRVRLLNSAMAYVS
jgi:hypothetical protein